nr:MAG TPA: hypothetical protein [Caudoviricetes sp.]
MHWMRRTLRKSRRSKKSADWKQIALLYLIIIGQSAKCPSDNPTDIPKRYLKICRKIAVICCALKKIGQILLPRSAIYVSFSDNEHNICTIMDSTVDFPRDNPQQIQTYTVTVTI